MSPRSIVGPDECSTSEDTLDFWEVDASVWVATSLEASGTQRGVDSRISSIQGGPCSSDCSRLVQAHEIKLRTLPLPRLDSEALPDSVLFET